MRSASGDSTVTPGPVLPLTAGSVTVYTGRSKQCLDQVAHHSDVILRHRIYLMFSVLMSKMVSLSCILNFVFSATCSAVLDDSDYVCDNCNYGWGGARCDACARGFYLDPTDQHVCIACQCNVYGSVSGECDPDGQCPCVPGIQGKLCDQCAPRHVIVDGLCESCVDGCTGVLFQDVDVIQQQVALMNLTRSKLLPWKRFIAIEEKLANMSSLEFVSRVDIPVLATLHATMVSLEAHAVNFAAQAHIMLSAGERAKVEGAELQGRATDVTRKLNREITKVKQVVTGVTDQLSNRCDTARVLCFVSRSI